METMIQMLFVFCLCPILGFSQVSEDPCTVADLGFLMDSSRTISKTNFQREKQVIEGLVNLYHVKPFGSRAGLLTFSTKPSLKAGIGEIETPEKLKELVRGIKPVRGSTYINLAIEEATRNLFGVRYVEPKRQEKILFILTDGMQTGRINLKIFTRSLRRLRVRIIAIAIGDNTDRRHLEELVAAPKDILYVKSWNNIKERIAAIHSHTCLKTPGFVKQCSKKIDIGFALDASGSMGNRSFNRERNFVIDMLKQFDLSETETNAGVIVYSLDPKLVIKFNEFYTLGEFERALKDRTPWKTKREALNMKVKWMNHKTRIDRALAMAKSKLFARKNGNRAGVRDVLIFLTDGKQNPPAERSLELYAKPLLDKKVNIISVGFGNAKQEELLKISSGPEYTLSYKGGVEVLEKAVFEILEKLCNYCEAKVNLGFVLDASRTTSHKFKAQKDLVSLITESFVPTPGGTQFCLSKFSDEGSLEIPFTHDNYDFTTELDFVTSVKGRTYIEKGLRAIEKEFDKNAIPGRPKILLVLTDGRQTRNSYLVKKAADDLRKKGVVIYAITTNEPYRMKVLKDIAGSNGSVMHLKLIKHLKNKIAQRVVKTVCPHGRTE